MAHTFFTGCPEQPWHPPLGRHVKTAHVAGRVAREEVALRRERGRERLARLDGALAAVLHDEVAVLRDRSISAVTLVVKGGHSYVARHL